MPKKDNLTVLKDGFRPLTEEELSVELTPEVSDEEMAAELAPDNNVISLNRERDITEDEDGAEVKERSGWAVAGVALAVLSLFFLPYILAPIGIILGYLGYREGDRSLGLWAMGLGAIGLLGTLIVAAFV